MRWTIIAALIVGAHSTTAALPANNQATDALVARADSLMQEGKLRLAREAYAQAIEHGAALDRDGLRARNLGMAYLEGVPADLRLAAKWLDIAWHLQSADNSTRLLLAQALAWSGAYDKAGEHYAALVAANPSSRNYALGLANVLLWSGNTKGAVEVLGSFVNRVPSDNQVRLQYAQCLAFSGQYASAMAEYQIVLQSDPHNLGAQVGIAKVLSWQNELQAARKLFDEILSTSPNQYDAQVGKAFTLLWLGQRAEARELFERLAVINPRDKEVVAALASLRQPAIAIRPGSSTSSTTPLNRPVPPDPLTLAMPPQTDPFPAMSPLVMPGIRTATTSFSPETLNAEAQVAEARGDLQQAARIYRELLRQEPGNTNVRLQLARVLSWDKKYPDSLAEYQNLISASPLALTPAIECARVLSWAREFDASVAAYRGVLARLQAQPAAQLGTSDIRLELARVLAWSRKYEDALQELERVLADPNSPRVAALVEQGRILSWSRRYDAALVAYDAALTRDPSNFDARLGRAQTLYWSGHLREAGALLRSLLRQKPADSTLRVTMAAVEYNSGRKQSALELLNDIGRNDDADSLRHNIRQDLRPVMRFRFGYGDDREIDAPGYASTLRALRYTAGIEFSLRPEVRIEISNTVTQGNTSNSLLAKYGADSLATSTMVRASFAPVRSLQLTLGAGEGTTGGTDFGKLQTPRRHEFLFEVRPVFVNGPFRLEGLITRRLADYTPLSVHDNVVEWREAFSAEYMWRRRIRFGADYWHANFSIAPPGQPTLTTSADGGAIRITPVLHRGERVTVEAGGRYELFRFDKSASRLQDPTQGIGSAGFFAPRFSQRYAATAHVAWQPARMLHVDLHGDYGPQRLFGFAASPLPGSWARTGDIGAQISATLRGWRPFVGVDYFTTQTAASPLGTTSPNSRYRSIAASFGVSYRF